MGPTVIVFHETRYANVLVPAFNEGDKTSESVIRERLANLNQVCSSNLLCCCSSFQRRLRSFLF